MNKPLNPSFTKKEIEPKEFLYTRKESIAMFKEGTRSFGIPGASLSWGIDGVQSGQTKAGTEGEKQVAKFLENISTKYKNSVAFHSIEWPGSNGDTDHMLLFGNLCFIIDAKRWKSKRKYSVTPKGQILRGTVPFTEGKVKMLPAMSMWRKVLPPDIKVVGVICIAQTEVYVPYDKNWWSAPFKLVTIENLEKFLDDTISYYVKKDPSLLKFNSQAFIEISGRVLQDRDLRAKTINLDLFK